MKIYQKFVFLLNAIFTFVGAIILLIFPQTIIGLIGGNSISHDIQLTIQFAGGIFAFLLMLISVWGIFAKRAQISLWILLIFHGLSFLSSLLAAILVNPQIALNCIFHVIFLIFLIILERKLSLEK